MKKLLLPVLAVLLITACNQDVRYTQNSPEIETFKAVIKDYDTKNYDNLANYYADTSKTSFNNTKMDSKEVPEYHKANDVAFSSRGFIAKGQEFEMVKTDKGETWVNFWGDWEGTLSANGKVINVPIHLTVRFIDGKIVRDYGYWDGSELTLALQDIAMQAKAMTEELLEAETE